MMLAALLTLLPLLTAQPDRFALPACTAPAQELVNHQAFILCHSGTHKLPLWTAYELQPQHLAAASLPRPSHFRQDTQLTQPAATDADYKFSGFSRSHMVPAADLAWSPDSLRASFLLSNAVPQYQAVNAGRWRQLENAVRRLAAHSDAVYIITGPIFDSSEIQTIGSHQVSVPTHTFKVILALHGTTKIIFAAILPNQPSLLEPLDHFTVSAAEVERRTGLDFFSSLDDSEEQTLESQSPSITSK